VRRIRRGAGGQSCASPSLSRMDRRRPLASAIAWIFVLRSPRERPIACFCSPFFARCRAVRLDMRRIDHLRLTGSAAAGQGAEQTFPNPALRPAHKAIVDRRRRTVLGRAIAPPAAALQHMQDATDHPPVICPILAASEAAPRSAATARRSAKTSCVAYSLLLHSRESLTDSTLNKFIGFSP
jgi:hypothetical protein